MKNASTTTKFYLSILILCLGLSIQAQQSPLEYLVKETKIQKLGQTKAISELAPKASTSRAKKDALKKNKKAPENFIGRGASKVTRPELEHQGPDPIRQSVMGSRAASEPIVNIDGLSNNFGSPHDPSGDIGTTHYVQAINATQIGVYTKDGTLESTFAANTLWSEFNINGAGDPIVLFDEMTQRWIITEFAFPALVLIAISDTEDPLGTYTAYRFSTPSFPDYPKYSIWPNAIVMTSNEGGAGQLHNYFIQRDSIMAGAENVIMQRIQITGNTNTEAGFFVSTPLDFSGSELPPYSLPMVMKINDSSWGDVDQDQVELFQFDIDWNDASNTQIIQTDLITTPFDSYPCSAAGFGFACVPQLNGSGLDAIPEVIMNIPQYRNFGTHESIVLSFITDATDGQNQSAIRWMELRRVDLGDWEIYQEGTYAPDSKDRYMCSIAIDKNGNIGLAYNVSSTEDFVGIRYTGRFANDPLGEMTIEEVTVVDGINRINSGGRFGDYGQMGVDPLDESTFWYTSEYGGNGNSNTRTRIVAFKIEKDEFDAAPISILSPTSSATLTDSEQVTVEVQNRGFGDIENLTVGLMLDGTTVGTFTIPDVLSENDVYQHIFAETIDLSVIGSYEIGVFTDFDEDENRFNDTIYTTISKIAQIDGSLTGSEDIETCDRSREVIFTLTNQGLSNITNAEIEIIVNQIAVDTIVFTGDLAMGSSTEIIGNAPELLVGTNIVEGRIISINNVGDENGVNDIASVNVNFVEGFAEYTLELQFDNFPGETAWTLIDSTTNQIVESGFGYSEPNALLRTSFCLPDNACYRFTIIDTQSDGICCSFGDGYYQITDSDGMIVAMGGDFGSSEETAFCAGVLCAMTLDVEVGENSSETNPTGSILINVSGGMEPYQYSIDNGQTFQENPLFENLAAGVYEILVVSGDGICEAMSEVEVGLATSVVDVKGDYKIVVSPNPGNGYYHVVISNFETQSYNMRMQVIDVNGKMLQELPLQKYSGAFEGDLSLIAYPSGTYYIRFLDNNISSISRIIKL